MTERPSSKKPWYWALGVGLLGLLAFTANAAGVFSFFTGVGSLPDIVNPPPPVDATPPVGEEAVVDSVQVGSIVLPATVFAYDSYGHETRQSHSLYAEEVSGAYAYGYWENEAGIWADATVAAGDGLGVIHDRLQQTSEAGQLTKEFGSETCVWRADSDPNTPRHEVWCFRIDDDRGIAMIVATHTADVGEAAPAVFANEVWNLTVVG